MYNRPDMGPRSDSDSSMRFPNFSLGELPTPQTGHIAPTLSPLDAFALQSRMLAQKFDEEKQKGRRISRLPPLTIEKEFRRPRPGFFRSPTSEEHGSPRQEDESTPQSAKEVKPDQRPVSQYPQMFGTEGPDDREPFQNNLTPLQEVDQYSVMEPDDYFAMPRSESPEPAGATIGPVQTATPITPPTNNADLTGPRYPGAVQRTLTVDSIASMRSNSSLSNLAPPRSPHHPRSPRASPSIRSVPNDFVDDMDNMSIGGSIDSLPQRQLSSQTSYSRSHSPCSPFQPPVPRSPSVSSQYSASGQGLARPAFNFSRPLSSASRPSFDTRPSFDAPLRHDSGDSADTRPSFESYDMPRPSYSQDILHTPTSMNSEEFPDFRDPHGQAAPSYIYSKYSLPRGRNITRESVVPHDWAMNQFRWSAEESPDAARPPSPPSPPRSTKSSSSQVQRTLTAESSNAEQRSASFDHSFDLQSAQTKRLNRSHPSTPSMSSNAPTMSSNTSTIKARLANSAPSSADMSPEDHLEKGIKAHQEGSLPESTYHMRLAARAGIPTAQLLYALAARHGWGMRPNQAEAVQWLKKAVDSAQLELADDEDLTKNGGSADQLADKKTHKAQFALSVYELGVSYMNGWGIQQDRALALRCFEIAGSWGDADALAEAGFCYTQGVGCRKDLKKAAKLYRAAEAKGMSMTGNSWIYKEKYMPKEEDDSRSGRSSRRDNPEKKPRDKSRTRTMFSRKKSVAASTAS